MRTLTTSLAVLATTTAASAIDIRLASGVVPLTFAVETQIPGSQPLDNAHVDVQTPYQAGGSFGSRYQTVGTEPAGTPGDSHLVVNPTNRLNLDAGGLANFDFIGATPDEDFWLLPQGQRPGGLNYLYLGVAADAVSQGARNEMVPWNPQDARVSSTPNRWIEWQLSDVQSPSGNGDFAVFQLSSGGGSTVFMSTVDSITSDDQLWMAAGSHGHYNWSFTEQGVWTVEIRAFTRVDLDVLPGDANLDGTVSILDFAILRANFGSGNSAFNLGDLNDDGVVSILDFAILRANFGTSLTISQLAAVDAWYATVVPEPALAGTLLLAAGASLTRRRV